MLYFLDFKFDIQQGLLFKNQSNVPLTPTQCKLLTLLIESKDKVLSKEDILDHVWQDRVVSEQVVFQNISQLRALISDEAIKTFPKRGYQWQLVLSTPPVGDTPSDEHPLKNTGRASLPLILALISFATISLCALFWYWPSSNITTNHSVPQKAQSVLLVPISPRFEGHLSSETQALNNTLSTNYLAPSNTSSAQAIFNSPYIEYKKLVPSSDKLILSGFVYQQRIEDEHVFLLEYRLQGHLRHWQGYLYGSTVNDLKAQLKRKIDSLVQSDYFYLQIDSFTTSELAMLNNQDPNDLDVLKHLIERLLSEYNHNVASARIEQMISLSEQQNHPIYMAYAQWLKARLFIALNQFQLAQQHLEQASNLMDQADFNALNSEISKSLADVAAHHKDFPTIQKHLYKSASQARLANRPVQEIRAYTLLSINAFKLKREKEKYDYLFQAKTLLADHQLDGSHYMLIFYHFALFEQTVEEKQRFYLKVLEQPVTPENYWVFFSVSEQLANLYLGQDQSEQALALTSNITEPARKHFLLAKIYHRLEQPELAKQHARTSFNTARMQHIDWVGLDMALKLLELGAELQDETDAMIYRHYIQNTARPRWQRVNREKLSKLGVINPYEQNKKKI
ncbi:winged helix-turn-helix domain-containing protein [Pseudoalteromonas sp. Of7M-16]|uniref:winged helix-turn-helix domain-containing protein n=1 Tax=Pseudoalteromonas sp. Of7M-16 TaxID=2917756 RepID=UPI001EF72DEF|nr:winged helix-turn-helix domain-containing protein [Pseudoalteromonas sp. Of7M-16]MCG7547436.1 winged helix-turn-helix domain-containing protein [Pseudoalteromonas sp. Of7M-16]